MGGALTATGATSPTIGVRLPNSGPFAEAPAILESAALAEELGYEFVWVHDHVSWPPDKLTHFATGSIEACRDQDPNFFESVTTSALLLGRLERIRVGIAGLVLPLRDPRVLAKQLAAIDVLSGSRLVPAFGIGAIAGDFEVMGAAYNRRGRTMNDHLAALRAILKGDQPVSVETEAVAFRDGTFLPRATGLPLWVTGSSEAGLVRAAAMADGWMTVYQSVETYRGYLQRLADLMIEVGRDPGLLETGYETYVCVAESTDAAIDIARASLVKKFASLERALDVCIVGSAEDVLDGINAYAAAGAAHVEVKFIGHSLGMIHDMMRNLAEVRSARAK